jgi:superfamily II DNA/RNA helicase
MTFTNFGLSDPLVQGILATGYTAPTEIQSQAIPAAISHPLWPDTGTAFACNGWL